MEVAAETEVVTAPKMTSHNLPLVKAKILRARTREADQETRTTTEVELTTRVATVEATTAVVVAKDVAEELELLQVAMPLGPVQTTSRHPSEEVGWSESQSD